MLSGMYMCTFWMYVCMYVLRLYVLMQVTKLKQL
jgi:hypothetical protein